MVFFNPTIKYKHHTKAIAKFKALAKAKAEAEAKAKAEAEAKAKAKAEALAKAKAEAEAKAKAEAEAKAKAEAEAKAKAEAEHDAKLIKEVLSAKCIYIYDKSVQYVKTIAEFDNSFKLYSKYKVVYLNIHTDFRVINKFTELNINCKIIIANSIAHHFIDHKYLSNLSNYNGIKMVFIQDEYYDIKKLVSFINNIKLDIVFTVLVNDQDIMTIYKEVTNKNIKYVKCLNGYISNSMTINYKKINEKTTDILYRGRKLHPRYGLLGYYKFEIGYKFVEYIKNNNINLNYNISSNNKDRIYDNWYEHMANTKITLGTPSGSNVPNYDNTLLIFINKLLNNDETSALLECDDNTYISHLKLINEYIKIPEILSVNMLSPKMFEAIACGTVLVMLEGDDTYYSGVLKPDVHYIPLKMDYSNMDEVILKLQDDDYLQTMADKAMNDIINQEKYTYKSFINKVDDIISKNINEIPSISSII
jgi:hypothetical protein